MAADENQAASALQAASRGRGARAAVQRKRELVKQQNEVAEARRQAQASELLGAAAKGYAQRRVAKQLEDERQQKAVMIQSRIRGHKERARPTAEANIRRARSANDPAQQGAAYLEQYHIMPLFEMLAQKLLSEKPADPKQFLVQTLEEMRAVKDPTSPKNFFSDTDIETLYCMYDIAQLGMTTAQCREALDAIGLPHVEVPAGPIDLAKFKSLVPEAV